MIGNFPKKLFKKDRTAPSFGDMKFKKNKCAVVRLKDKDFKNVFVKHDMFLFEAPTKETRLFISITQVMLQLIGRSLYGKNENSPISIEVIPQDFVLNVGLGIFQRYYKEKTADYQAREQDSELFIQKVDKEIREMNGDKFDHYKEIAFRWYDDIDTNMYRGVRFDREVVSGKKIDMLEKKDFGNADLGKFKAFWTQNFGKNPVRVIMEVLEEAYTKDYSQVGFKNDCRVFNFEYQDVNYKSVVDMIEDRQRK